MTPIEILDAAIRTAEAMAVTSLDQVKRLTAARDALRAAPEPVPTPAPTPAPDQPVLVKLSREALTVLINAEMAAQTTHKLTPSQMAAWLKHFQSLPDMTLPQLTEAIRAMVAKDWGPGGQYTQQGTDTGPVVISGVSDSPA